MTQIAISSKESYNSANFLGYESLKNLHQERSGALIINYPSEIVEFEHPEGFNSISNLIDELSTLNGGNEYLMEARKEVASELYGEQKTLASIRLSKGFSQRDLAAVTGIDQPYIARIEKGRAEPGRLIMKKLCRALNITMTDLDEALD